MKIKIFLDFDGTLFETTLLKEKMFQVCRDFNFNDDEILDKYRLETADGLFSPDGFLKRFEGEKDFNYPVAYKKIQDQIEKSSLFLFPDTISFLSKLDRTKFEINLMTLGDDNFQRSKVSFSKIEPYFDNLYFVSQNKWEIMNKFVGVDEKFIFIDDREDTIKKIGDLFANSLCLCIKRKDEDHDDLNKQIEYQDIKKIKQLDEVFDYV